MDLSLFTDQTVNVRLKNQNFYEGVKLTYTQNANYVLGSASGSCAVYGLNGTALGLPDIGLDIEDIQLTNLNLNDYVGHDVEITLRSWDKHQCALKKNPSSEYPFVSNESGVSWTKEGKWFHAGNDRKDIIHIKLSKPQPAVMNRSELLSTIAETKKQLTVLEKQLAQSPPTLQDAVVGDVLADGSEVVYKYPGPGIALLAAPSEFNRHAADPNFETYFSNLGTRFNRWDWFIPTAELLELVFGNLDPNNFNKVPYWTSCEKRWWPVNSPATGGARIRAFRYVTY